MSIRSAIRSYLSSVRSLETQKRLIHAESTSVALKAIEEGDTRMVRPIGMKAVRKVKGMKKVKDNG